MTIGSRFRGFGVQGADLVLACQAKSERGESSAGASFVNPSTWKPKQGDYRGTTGRHGVGLDFWVELFRDFFEIWCWLARRGARERACGKTTAARSLPARWTGLVSWDFEFPFSGSLITTFLSYTITPNLVLACQARSASERARENHFHTIFASTISSGR